VAGCAFAARGLKVRRVERSRRWPTTGSWARKPYANPKARPARPSSKAAPGWWEAAYQFLLRWPPVSAGVAQMGRRWNARRERLRRLPRAARRSRLAFTFNADQRLNRSRKSSRQDQPTGEFTVRFPNHAALRLSEMWMDDRTGPYLKLLAVLAPGA